tara:strand:+ start:120 stop:935 length:816 start_codon:yes stop_codon:yes gene_type:complete
MLLSWIKNLSAKGEVLRVLDAMFKETSLLRGSNKSSIVISGEVFNSAKSHHLLELSHNSIFSKFVKAAIALNYYVSQTSIDSVERKVAAVALFRLLKSIEGTDLKFKKNDLLKLEEINQELLQRATKDPETLIIVRLFHKFSEEKHVELLNKEALIISGYASIVLGMVCRINGGTSRLQETITSLTETRFFIGEVNPCFWDFLDEFIMHWELPFENRVVHFANKFCSINDNWFYLGQIILVIHFIDLEMLLTPTAQNVRLISDSPDAEALI